MPRRRRPRHANPTDDVGGGGPIPEAPPVVVGEDGVDLTRRDALALVAFLERRVDRLTEELADARTEMRGFRYEADSLRVDAGRAAVFAALVEAERARAAEIRAKRDVLADELARSRRPWMARFLRP